jgi:hypothetical protein
LKESNIWTVLPGGALYLIERSPQLTTMLLHEEFHFEKQVTPVCVVPQRQIVQFTIGSRSG